MAETEVKDDSKPKNGFMNWLESYFKLKENGTTLKTEIIAGITSFMTMAYIIVVNPSILGGLTGESEQALMFATVLISFVMSVVMGFLSNNPYAVAPGMGLNAYVGLMVATGKLTWEGMMGAIIIAGALLTLMSLTPISSGVLKAIPKSLRYGLAAGIGLFLVFLGLFEAGVIQINVVAGVDPGDATLAIVYDKWISIVDFNLEIFLFLFGLILTSILMIKKVKGAFLIGILSTSLLSILLTVTTLGNIIDPSYNPIQFGDGDNFFQKIIAMPDTSTFFRFSFKGILEPAVLISIFTLAFTDLFDSVSTFLGVSEVGGLLNEDGDPKNFKKTLIADSMTTMVSGFFGTSDATTYIESAAGVEQGGRTGITAIITGLCFLPFMFFSPLLGLFPGYTTGPVLVLLGVLMFRPLLKIDWNDLEEAIPTFIALTMIPFSYSITNGIVYGILAYVLIKVIVGKIKEINAWLWLTFVFAIFSLIAPLI